MYVIHIHKLMRYSRKALEMLMKALDDSRTKGNKSKIDPSSFIDKCIIKEPLNQQMWEGNKTGKHLPLIGDQVGVLFGNGTFLGMVLRVVSGDDSGGGGGDNNEMLFDVGFSGEHVEINVPLSRLTSPLSMNAASNNNSSSGGGGGKLPTEGKNGHLRVVCLSLNMSHQPLQTTNDDDGGVSGGGGGVSGGEDDHGFSMWVCDDGVFEAVAVDDLHEQADIVVLSLQDVPTSKC